VVAPGAAAQGAQHAEHRDARRPRQGVTKKEIGEILLHSAIYCGYPAALGGFRTAREYFAKRERKHKR
jgi:alkylhydroperoxidase/carboxymuconolactone decarboxylase family protein YurZ